MQALTLLRISAAANRLANHRLHAAMAPLTDDELRAPRTGFFPSLLATLNHVLEVDGYYISALHAEPEAGTWWDRFVAAGSLPELAQRQAASDERLRAWLAAATPAALAATVHLPRSAARVQTDRAAHVLQHLFMHQVHHRGQLHAMLSGTRIAPPQLDEFLMPSEGYLRQAEMLALGWDEGTVYGG